MLVRSRWAAVGAVVAVSLGAGGMLTASAAGSVMASSFVPITPCRLFDTRAGAENIGMRSTPVGADETFVVPVWGTTGNCTIPSGATGVSLNVASINSSASSYLTVFASDASRPLSSNLNWSGGQGPTSNAVTTALSADGRVSLYNHGGTVDLFADVVGYYEPSTSAAQGSAGAVGPTGVAGPAGPAGVVGPVGPAGAVGPTGTAGLTGATGPAGTSGLLLLGQFTPTQLIQAGILTCTNASTLSCTGPQLNGLDLSNHTDIGSVNAICNTVDGSTYNSIGYSPPSSNTRFAWNGTNWVLETGPAQSISYIACQ